MLDTSFSPKGVWIREVPLYPRIKVEYIDLYVIMRYLYTFIHILKQMVWIKCSFVGYTAVVLSPSNEPQILTFCNKM